MSSWMLVPVVECWSCFVGDGKKRRQAPILILRQNVSAAPYADPCLSVHSPCCRRLRGSTRVRDGVECDMDEVS